MRIKTLSAAVIAAFAAAAPLSAQSGEPVIDMHVHAWDVDTTAPPLGYCIPLQQYMPASDPRLTWPEQFFDAFMNPSCDDPVPAVHDEDELIADTVRRLRAANAIAIVQGSPERVRKWHAAAPERVIPSLGLNLGEEHLSPEDMRSLFEDGTFRMLGEVANQYAGIGPDDPRMDPYWALVEELDIPVGYHFGTGMPGSGGFGMPYRVAKGNPVLLEEVLARYPRLRISIQHMGEGYHEQLKIMLWAYPQLYVEISGPITWAGEAFHDDLRDLVEAGFGKRIMFGSDGMNFAGVFDRSLAIIEGADYLSSATSSGTMRSAS